MTDTTIDQQASSATSLWQFIDSLPSLDHTTNWYPVTDTSQLRQAFPDLGDADISWRYIQGTDPDLRWHAYILRSDNMQTAFSDLYKTKYIQTIHEPHDLYYTGIWYTESMLVCFTSRAIGLHLYVVMSESLYDD